MDCIRANPQVCVSAVPAAKTHADLLTTKYASVIVHGKAQEITSDAAKKDMILKLAKQIGSNDKVKQQETLDAFFAGMAVVCIEIEEITGKHSA